MEPLILARSSVSTTPKRNRISHWLKPSTLVWILIVITFAFTLITALSSGKGLSWLFEIKAIEGRVIDDVAIVLAPLLALALAIERIIETFFDLFEQSTEDVAKLTTAGEGGLKWLREELDRAWQAAEGTKSNLDTEDTDKNSLLKELEAAEERINKANSRIAGLSKDPKYIATKRMLSIWIGLLLGLIVAIISDSGILEALQIGVPRILDMIVTGFVIGAGSGPMHSLMGILQGTKNTLESLGELASLAPLKKQIKELQDQIKEN